MNGIAVGVLYVLMFAIYFLYLVVDRKLLSIINYMDELEEVNKVNKKAEEVYLRFSKISDVLLILIFTTVGLILYNFWS